MSRELWLPIVGTKDALQVVCAIDVVNSQLSSNLRRVHRESYRLRRRRMEGMLRRSLRNPT